MSGARVYLDKTGLYVSKPGKDVFNPSSMDDFLVHPLMQNLSRPYFVGEADPFLKLSESVAGSIRVALFQYENIHNLGYYPLFRVNWNGIFQSSEGLPSSRIWTTATKFTIQIGVGNPASDPPLPATYSVPGGLRYAIYRIKVK